MMVKCSRCGAEFDKESNEERNYCDDCEEKFQEVLENGGFRVRRRYGNKEYRKYPYVIDRTYNLERGSVKHDYKDPIKALAAAKKLQDLNNVDVLYVDQRNMYKWVLDNYLKQHPDIQEEVREKEKEIEIQ